MLASVGLITKPSSMCHRYNTTTSIQIKFKAAPTFSSSRDKEGQCTKRRFVLSQDLNNCLYLPFTFGEECS